MADTPTVNVHTVRRRADQLRAALLATSVDSTVIAAAGAVLHDLETALGALVARRRADDTVAALRRRIDGALYLIDQHDPATGVAGVAVLQSHLRTALQDSREEVARRG